MKSVLHRSESRGHANHGWLDTHHTFSFAGYYNPERMHFGVLRVLNDDIVDPGMGFGTHPHENMEIISIPLKGDLEHKDSMGNTHVISRNDVQVMSAGSGIYHSEYNKNSDQSTNFLQIWIFPNRKNVDPRYGQSTFDPADRKNRFQQVLSPNKDDEGVWIYQDAWFHMADIDPGEKLVYDVKKEGNGVYIFLLEGKLNANGFDMKKRDGLGVWETDRINFEGVEKAEVLLMEVPMVV